MLQFRRFLELFLLLQFQNHLWYRMGYIVIFNRLAGIPAKGFSTIGRTSTCAADGIYVTVTCGPSQHNR